jgi:prepilin-type N-terminal cleavage/methylation domain-containing protein
MRITSLQQQKRKGFTLVELIVAMGIFGFAATFAIASLLALVSVQRKAMATQEAFDNVRFALEFMAKETREAKTIMNPCADGGDPTFLCEESLILVRGAARTNFVTYSWRVDSTTGRKSLWRRETDGGTLISDYPLTDDRMRINHAAFYISNDASITDNYQPYVIFVINATAGDLTKPSEQATVHLQTAASLFRLDRPDN